MQNTRPIQILNLPGNVLLDILTRLPVKTLTIVSCVNKFFFGLISRPDFIKIHLEVSKEDASLSNYGVLFHNWSSQNSLEQCSINSFMCENLIDLVSLDYPASCSPTSSLRIVGSCNGLVCIVKNDEDFLLWNPVTRKSKKLPHSPLDVNTTDSCVHLTYGFGFVESNGDYKVVVICSSDFELVAYVYSLNSNSWKKTKGFKNCALVDFPGVLANGNLHWLTNRTVETNSRNDIVSFDVESEKFGIVTPPNCGEGSFDFSMGTLGEFLCVLYHDRRVSGIVWVMKEYGVADSWTKVLYIPISFNYYHRKPHYLEPRFMLPNGKLILSGAGYLIRYDRRIKAYTYLSPKGIHPDSIPFIYVESLVSPDGNGKRGWQIMMEKNARQNENIARQNDEIVRQNDEIKRMKELVAQLTRQNEELNREKEEMTRKLANT